LWALGGPRGTVHNLPWPQNHIRLSSHLACMIHGCHDSHLFAQSSNETRNISCIVINVDGSCLSNPILDGYGGIICNFSYVLRASLSQHNLKSTDILQVEL